jgi:hypothetical protein
MQFQRSSFFIAIMCAVSSIFSLQAVIDTATVPGALYAELHGVVEDQGTVTVCRRLYKAGISAYGVHGKVKQIICRTSKVVRVDFFDANGNWLRGEQLTPQDIQDKDALIKTLQSRLTVLPSVHHVAVTSVKSSQNQTIVLYDVQGFCIATLYRYVPRSDGNKHGMLWLQDLREGDVIPESVIAEQFADKINNPEFLKALRIIRTHQPPAFEWPFGKK